MNWRQVFILFYKILFKKETVKILEKITSKYQYLYQKIIKNTLILYSSKKM